MRIHSIADDIVAMSNIRTLRQEREKRGLTQLELSEKLGISSQGVISAIELGKRCKASDYNKLADFLGWERYVPCRRSSESNSMNDGLMLSFENEPKKATQHRRQRRRYDDNQPYVKIPEELRKDLSLLAYLQATTITDIVTKLITDYVAQYRTVIASVNALRYQIKQEDKSNDKVEL